MLTRFRTLVRLLTVVAFVQMLQGCLFLYIPGSMVSSVSDSITGAEGNNCVGASAKIGDRVNVPNMKPATVKSLSGTSIRCTDPALPIRALLAFEN